jgi:hypothetical protein
MRNLLFTLVLCAAAQLASAGCPATAVVPAQTAPAAELISSAAPHVPLDAAAAQPGPVMIPASVQAHNTQVMGAPHAPGPAVTEAPREGSRLTLVLAALGAMLVIVLRRLAAFN